MTCSAVATRTAVDDVCPRSAGGADAYPDGKLVDKGCGAKKRDKTLGDPIVVDVLVK
jgi:hypothetical protein